MQAIMKQINFPAEQTTVVLGALGITPQDADFYSLTGWQFYFRRSRAGVAFITQIRIKRGFV